MVEGQQRTRDGGGTAAEQGPPICRSLSPSYSSFSLWPSVDDEDSDSALWFLQKEYDKDGKKMKMAVMELVENDYRIRCALFGEYVDKVNRFLSSRYAEQPVVILQLAKVKDFRGRVGLQNVMFASKFGFNLDIPEVAAFQKKVYLSIPHGVSASQPIGIVGSGKNIEIEEDFMKLTPRCTVKSLDDNNRAGTFVVLVKIAEIVEDGPWWYFVCVCGRGVQAKSEIYFCQFCNIHITNVTPRFRVKVLFEDSTGISIFVLFDREASYLLNKTCAQLFEQHLKDVDRVFLSFSFYQYIFSDVSV
ncbi:uncharacterized protein LOC107607154 [Arachis ipaensis]|uniref:uncharacterized protein LOC107607154 n=1 Tax=Arachis ipaensis TaxID=130454 RepID=UPI000A2B2C74|nr:uncharacterized protein LOC107607154 [Arachis ipaensis]